MIITLGPGEDRELSQDGFSFYLINADGPVKVDLKELDGRADQSEVLQSGQGLKGNDRFERVKLTNNHNQAQDIEFYIGSMEFVDNRDTGVVTLSGGIQVNTGGAVNALADTTIAGTAVKTIAANSARKELHIWCDQPLRYGSGAGSSAGIPIPKETVAILDTDNALDLYNAGAVTANLSIVEVLH